MKKYIVLLLLVVFMVSCTPRLYEIKEANEIMGTIVTITIYDTDKERANDAMGAAFSEISRIDRLLSNYKNDSEISILNRDKILEKCSPDLLLNVGKAIYYGELSDGAFDITVQPILDLYTESFSVNKRPPTDEEIKKELEKVDYKKVIIEDEKFGSGVVIGDDQEITLGGIAKGYAIEKAVDILLKRGIKHALVNAGGDVRAIGKKYGSTDWSIALANPRDKSDYITLVNLDNNSVVTSGDYERYFDENKTFHHIVNPKTGYSATELMSVTIIADNAFDADAISTSVFVLGKEKGMDLIESLDNVEGLIITREKEIVKSRGFD